MDANERAVRAEEARTITDAHNLGEHIVNHLYPYQRQRLLQLIDTSLGKRELLRALYLSSQKLNT